MPPLQRCSAVWLSLYCLYYRMTCVVQVMTVNCRFYRLLLCVLVACWLSEMALVRATEQEVAVRDGDIKEGVPGQGEEDSEEESSDQEAVQVACYTEQCTTN